MNSKDWICFVTSFLCFFPSHLLYICVDAFDFSYLFVGILCQRRPFFLYVDVCVKCSQFASFLFEDWCVRRACPCSFVLPSLTLWSWERNPWSPFCSHLKFPPQVWFMGFKKEKAHFFFKGQNWLASDCICRVLARIFGFNKKWPPVLGRACFWHAVFKLFWWVLSWK